MSHFALDHYKLATLRCSNAPTCIATNQQARMQQKATQQAAMQQSGAVAAAEKRAASLKEKSSVLVLLVGELHANLHNLQKRIEHGSSGGFG